MPVIIDELDLVDTEPAPPRELGPSVAPGQAAGSSSQVLDHLRLAVQRAARVLAD